jgi:hypothetical protein
MSPFLFRRWILDDLAPVARRSRKSRRKRSTRRALAAERLEERQLLTLYTVTSTNDSGAGSLREAVAKANADAAPDVIRFDSSLSNKTIVLTSKDANPKTTANGRCVYGRTGLAINSDIMIDGLGVRGLQISGNDERRLFVVAGKNAPTPVTGAKLTLNNIDLVNGRSKGGLGGGAGLGGAVFVDQGGSFSAESVGFRKSTAVGGEGVRGTPLTTNFSYDPTYGTGGPGGGLGDPGRGSYAGENGSNDLDDVGFEGAPGGFGSGGGSGGYGRRFGAIGSPGGFGGGGGGGGGSEQLPGAGARADSAAAAAAAETQIPALAIPEAEPAQRATAAATVEPVC